MKVTELVHGTVVISTQVHMKTNTLLCYHICTYCPFLSICEVVTSAELLAVRDILDADVSASEKSNY